MGENPTFIKAQSPLAALMQFVFHFHGVRAHGYSRFVYKDSNGLIVPCTSSCFREIALWNGPTFFLLDQKISGESRGIGWMGLSVAISSGDATASSTTITPYPAERFLFCSELLHYSSSP